MSHWVSFSWCSKPCKGAERQAMFLDSCAVAWSPRQGQSWRIHWANVLLVLSKGHCVPEPLSALLPYQNGPVAVPLLCAAVITIQLRVPQDCLLKSLLSPHPKITVSSSIVSDVWASLLQYYEFDKPGLVTIIRAPWKAVVHVPKNRHLKSTWILGTREKTYHFLPLSLLCALLPAGAAAISHRFCSVEWKEKECIVVRRKEKK